LERFEPWQAPQRRDLTADCKYSAIAAMPDSGPPIGLRHSQTITVTPELTVPEVSTAFAQFRDMPPVFATALMVGFVEDTCVAALRPFLSQGQRTVGIGVNLTHSAVTPVGMKVTAEVELVEVDGRRLKFRVVCRDDAETIGEGWHERAIIDHDRFLARVAAKQPR
jgi:fluoroacetyl-CoA thioesterase